MARLQKIYRDEIVAKLMTSLAVTNPMQVPKITKISVNMGVGEAVADKKAMDGAVNDLAAMRGRERLDDALADGSRDGKRELAALPAVRLRGGDEVLHRHVATDAASDDDDIGPPVLDGDGGDDVRVGQLGNRVDDLVVRERDPERGLGQHLRIDHEAALIALPLELGTMNRAIHGHGETLAQDNAGDDLLGSLTTHTLTIAARTGPRSMARQIDRRRRRSRGTGRMAAPCA